MKLLSIAYRFWKAKSPEQRALVDLDTHYTEVFYFCERVCIFSLEMYSPSIHIMHFLLSLFMLLSCYLRSILDMNDSGLP